MTSMRISQRLGMWPTNIIASRTGTHTMQEPRSGWMRIINQGAPTMAPQQRMRKKAGMARVFERKRLRVRMPAMIASCEGWKLMGPRSSQLRAP